MANEVMLNKKGSPADVPGFLVGHATDKDGPTGCTAVLCTQGAVGGVAMGGWATGTRGMDGLKPEHVVRKVQGVFFTGGSTFGLSANDGALRWLEERGLGNQAGPYRVPSLPAAVIFDLPITGAKTRPGPEMGWQACDNAGAGYMERGNVGAGTGATVGKLLGLAGACKGGVGGASLQIGDIHMGALAVVNAFGDIIDSQGRIIAGSRKGPDSREFLDAGAFFMSGAQWVPVTAPQNTTLAVICTNAALDKLGASKIAAAAQTGFARCIEPCMSEVDGDLVCVLSNGDVRGDPVGLGVMAARLVQMAVWDAVLSAESLTNVPAATDMEAMSRLWPA